MYFDAIVQRNGTVVYNSTKADVLAFFHENPETVELPLTVVDGATLHQFTPTEYLARFGQKGQTS